MSKQPIFPRLKRAQHNTKFLTQWWAGIPLFEASIALTRPTLSDRYCTMGWGKHVTLEGYVNWLHQIWGYISLGGSETSTVRLYQLDAPSIVPRVQSCATAQKRNLKPAPQQETSLQTATWRGYGLWLRARLTQRGCTVSFFWQVSGGLPGDSSFPLCVSNMIALCACTSQESQTACIAQSMHFECRTFWSCNPRYRISSIFYIRCYLERPLLIVCVQRYES
jgi:hypothetical protein